MSGLFLQAESPVPLVALALTGVVLFVCVSQAIRQLPLASGGSGRVLAVCVTLLALMHMKDTVGQLVAEPHGLPGILLLGILVVCIAIAFAATASSGLRKDRKRGEGNDRELR